MALNEKSSIIDGHLNELKKSEKSKNGLFFMGGGIAVAAVVAFMAFTSSDTKVNTMNSPSQIESEIPKPVLTSNSNAIEHTGIVAVITPTREQLDKLNSNEEGRKIIEENKKRKEKTKKKVTKKKSINNRVEEEEVNEIGLTQEEIMLLEEADILGPNGQIIKESDLKRVAVEAELPAPFNNPVGISNETYKAEDVKHLHTVTTGYVQKVYRGAPKNK